jgi:hypothetical protein
MRMRALPLVLAILASVAACDSGRQVVAGSRSVIPPAVNCGDAPQLLQRVAADRRQIGESRSDHERISVGSRANFLGTLALIADLKCKVVLAEVDEALKPALEAARQAESNASVYEQTRGFHEADFLARRAVDLLIERLGAPGAK